MIDDDDIPGPINGHNKSEAIPLGCFGIIAAAMWMIVVLGLYGAFADGWK